MLIVLFGLKYIYYNNSTTLTAILTIILHAAVGATVYFILTNKFKLGQEIFGKDFKNILLRKLKLKRN